MVQVLWCQFFNGWQNCLIHGGYKISFSSEINIFIFIDDDGIHSSIKY